MEIRIDSDSAVPMYMQIVHSIMHQVATGTLKPGQQLPTVRELAADLRLNPNTVARAYDQLDRDDVITTQQGRGTYVREHPDNVHLTRVRQEQLRTMMDSAVGKALSMGYAADEIKITFDAEFERWVRMKKT
jgi:GntR family transcriptional regulator